MGVAVHERELIDGAVDLAIESGGAWTQRLLIPSAGAGVGVTLAEVLAEQLKGERYSSDAQYSKAEYFAKLAAEQRLGVRVIDRLSGKQEPVVDLVWDEAKVSGHVVVPGSLVVFSVKKDGPEKTSP